jgi:hypothetical protein
MSLDGWVVFCSGEGVGLLGDGWLGASGWGSSEGMSDLFAVLRRGIFGLPVGKNLAWWIRVFAGFLTIWWRVFVVKLW